MLLGSTSAGGNSFSFLFGRFLFVFSVLFYVVFCCCFFFFFFFTIFYQLAGSNLFILHAFPHNSYARCCNKRVSSIN